MRLHWCPNYSMILLRNGISFWDIVSFEQQVRVAFLIYQKGKGLLCVCMCVLPTANWYIYVPPGLVSCPWGRKINEVSPYTDVPKGGKVNWKELGCFINFKRGCSAPSTCLSWIPKMKGLPPQRKATQESCQPAADPCDLSVETP